MKVKFKYGIRTYSGTLDEMTYGSYRNGKVCIGRTYVYPKLTDNNALRGNITKNLAKLWNLASGEYREDFKDYSRRYGSLKTAQRKLVPTGFAFFMKAMSAWAKDEDPALDLSTLTAEDMDNVGTKVSSVAECVENGYLVSVPGHFDLDNEY